MRSAKLCLLLVALIALSFLACAEEPVNPATNTYKDPSVEELKKFAESPKKSDLSQKGTPWETSSLSDENEQTQISGAAVALGQATSPNYLERADAFFDGVMANNIYSITVEEYLTKSQAEPQGWAIVDIRPADLYAQGHIPAAINIPFTELVPLLGTVPSGKKVAVYCTSDTNAAYGVMTLRVFGERDAYLLQGGVLAWEAAGQTVVQ